MNDEFISLGDILRKAEGMPLCAHFLSTRTMAKYRTVMSWLATCDIDTLQMINQSFAKVINPPPETPQINTGHDIFDKEEIHTDRIDMLGNVSEDDAVEVDDVTDLFLLTSLLLFWEKNSNVIESDKVDSAIVELAEYAAVEILRRNNFITFEGSGMFFASDNKTKPVKNKAKKRGRRK
jgi:hypothetical protein